MIAEPFGDLFTPVPVNDVNPATQCRPRFTAEFYMSAEFLLNEAARMLIKLELGCQSRPDSLLLAAVSLGGSDIPLFWPEHLVCLFNTAPSRHSRKPL